MLSAIALAASMTAAPATEGIGIQAGNVCLAQTTQPGQSYALPDLYVRDTGTVTEPVVVTPSPLPTGSRLYRGENSVPGSWVGVSYGSSWFGFEKNHSASVDPGQAVNIPLSLSVPAGAAPGLYVGEVTAAAAGPGGSGSAQVSASLGAAGITYVIFSVSGGVPSCLTPPPAGVPYAAQYAPDQPADGTVTTAWLRKHEPWVFKAAAPTVTSSPATGAAAGSTSPSAAAPAATALDSRRNEGIAGAVAVFGLLVIRKVRRRRPS